MGNFRTVSEDYIFGRAESKQDIDELVPMFSRIFHPEPVADLARTLSDHFPRMKTENWFVAREKKSRKIVSAFALIPWTWRIGGLDIQVAEMGIVGTLEEHRDRGLMKALNRLFDRTLEEERFDLAVIQGIPGFYHNFGYRYSVDLENHIDLPFHAVPEKLPEERFQFRRAEVEDIPFLIEEDSRYRNYFHISSVRDEGNWKYMLNESLKTEYGSEFWIMELPENGGKYYFRIPLEGFGDGLILSETSVEITRDALLSAFVFARKLAVKRKKPYIRINSHSRSPCGKLALAMGASKGRPYAWQVKIPDKVRFLKKLSPVLEKRMRESCFHNFSGRFKLDFFRTSVLTAWKEGRLESVRDGAGKECEAVLFVNDELAPALLLCWRDWKELQFFRPDIFPAPQYIGSAAARASDISGLLADILFPPLRSWVYGQY
jgi:predicted N-acetyltransferase YhbS